MSGADRNDASAAMLVKFVERQICFGDERGERRGTKRDLALSAGWSDEDKPAPDFDLRAFLREIAPVSTHTVVPSPKMNRRSSGIPSWA